MIWLKLIGAFLARYWDKLLAFVGGWTVARQHEKIKDLKSENRARSVAKEVEDDVEARKPADVHRDLDRWMRD